MIKDFVMDEDKRIKRIKKRIIGISIGLIVLIGLVFGFYIYGRKTPDVIKIVNYVDIEDVLPSGARDTLKTSLYYLLSQNFEVPNGVDKIKVDIRGDTLVEIIEDDVISVEFISDIDDYQQTYKISMAWSDELDLPVDVLIECTAKEEAKFPDAMCYGMYNNSDSIELYLPHTLKTKSNKEFLLKFGYYDENGNEKVIAFVDNCNKDIIENEIMLATKDYITSVGIDPNLIDIKVSYIYDKCIIK